MMKTKTTISIAMMLMASILISLFSSCNQNYSPRPYGYFRIDMPEQIYEPYNKESVPYIFDKSKVANIIPRTEEGEKYWIDISYPNFNADIHCSYKQIDNNLFELSEDARTYVYKHSVKADGIGEQVFQNEARKVYGILYEIKGNTASSIQFVLTDSSRHFFRAALYFDNVPNKDSIAPVVNYLREDIVRLMESFDWK